jgi:hypothetical protein
MRVLEGRVIKDWIDKKYGLEGLHIFLCIKAIKCTENWAGKTGSIPHIIKNAQKIVQKNGGHEMHKKMCRGL